MLRHQDHHPVREVPLQPVEAPQPEGQLEQAPLDAQARVVLVG